MFNIHQGGVVFGPSHGDLDGVKFEFVLSFDQLALHKNIRQKVPSTNLKKLGQRTFLTKSPYPSYNNLHVYVAPEVHVRECL